MTKGKNSQGGPGGKQGDQGSQGGGGGGGGGDRKGGSPHGRGRSPGQPRSPVRGNPRNNRQNLQEYYKQRRAYLASTAQLTPEDLKTLYDDDATRVMRNAPSSCIYRCFAELQPPAPGEDHKMCDCSGDSDGQRPRCFIKATIMLRNEIKDMQAMLVRLKQEKDAYYAAYQDVMQTAMQLQTLPSTRPVRLPLIQEPSTPPDLTERFKKIVRFNEALIGNFQVDYEQPDNPASMEVDSHVS